MNQGILFGLWICLSLFSIWLPCECKSVPQEDGKDSLLIQSVMHAAGIDPTVMTTQSSVFVSKSGLIKGVASVAVPIHSESKENSTTIVNATATQIPTASEKMVETTESPSSNLTDNNTTPAPQTTIESTDVTTISTIVPENVTETATTPSNSDLTSTNVTETPANASDGNHSELSGNTETTTNPQMINGNETEALFSSNDTLNTSNSDNGLSNANATDYPLKAIELPIKIADAVSSLFGVHGSAVSNSSGEMTEFTLKVAVNWLTHNLTVSW